MPDLHQDFFRYLQESYFKEKILRRGISLGFLASVMFANIEEYIDDMLEFAAEIGEFNCPQCDNYYCSTDAKIDKDSYLLCPDCGGKLTSSWCDACGEDIGHNIPMIKKNGMVMCQRCAAKG